MCKSEVSLRPLQTAQLPPRIGHLEMTRKKFMPRIQQLDRDSSLHARKTNVNILDTQLIEAQNNGSNNCGICELNTPQYPYPVDNLVQFENHQKENKC